MIVITLTKVPASLRGDLTRWCQEIQAGVYVGNVNARIRELLWDRVMRNIGNGEATIVYNTNNELGYTFKTTRKDRKVENFDGIPLMKKLNTSTSSFKSGFSNAAKYHRARVMNQNRRALKKNVTNNDFVVIDIETSGLEIAKDVILSIGAIKLDADGELRSFYKLIKRQVEITPHVQKLTGITTENLIADGECIDKVLDDFKTFIGTRTVIGYNLDFDFNFIQKEIKDNSLEVLSNAKLDILRIIRRRDRFLDNYRLETVLNKYGITNDNPHNSLEDAMATWKLLDKLIKKGWI